jgi:hypothetical protein
MSLADTKRRPVNGGAEVSLADRIDLRDSCGHAIDDVACLTIPGDLVEGVAATVLGLYAARAEELGASVSAFLEGREQVAELEHARGELRAMEDALSDLG